jgi:DNA polymerase III subunit alpha
LGAIKGVGRPAMLGVDEVRAGQAFTDLTDFATRVDPRLVNKRCMEALARAGAFDSIESNRARALAAAPALSSLAASAEVERASGQISLFAGPSEARPVLPEATPFSEADRLDHELDSVGFYLSGHPLDDLMAGGLRERIVLAAHREEVAQTRSFLDMVGVVRSRVEKVSKTGGKFAYVRLSDPSGEYELMVPPELLQTSREILEPGEKIFCRVKVRRQEEEIRLAMENVRRLSEVSLGSHDALYVRLTPQASITQLAQFAAQLQRAKAAASGALFLEIPIEGESWVTVALKGSYPVDLGAMSALKSVPGVDQVRPAAA